MSPELIMLLPIAMLGDALGWILLLFGLDDFGLLDIVLDLFFTSWIALRKKDPTVFKKILLRALGFEALEVIPYVGDVFPGYTLLVITTVMSSQKARDQEVVDKNEAVLINSAQGADNITNAKK
jgi:hypothetical protein